MEKIFRSTFLPAFVLLLTLLLLLAFSGAVQAQTVDQAQFELQKDAAVKAAREAIQKLPPFPEISNEHRAAVAEARRLADIAMLQYGASRHDICSSYAYLEMVEQKLDLFVPQGQALPSTGGVHSLLALGAMLTATGLLFALTGKKK